jgi:uncharacterized repeat protein (TIGR03803 family)
VASNHGFNSKCFKISGLGWFEFKVAHYQISLHLDASRNLGDNPFRLWGQVVSVNRALQDALVDVRHQSSTFKGAEMKVVWHPRVCILYLILSAASIGSSAQTFRVLANFNGTNGANPDPKPIVQGTDGNLYSTSPNGGLYGYGTAFKMTPQGELTVLHNFCELPACADGAFPGPGVVLGADRNFYGVAGGGANNLGEVFRITAAGVLTVLHSFDSTDGAYPNSNLVQGADGSFYGTTVEGGNLSSCSGFLGCGSVFKITPGGVFTSLHNFCNQTNCTDGAITWDGLALGDDGNLYGGTWQGGANNLGTIYKITPEGAFTTLYSFCAANSCAGGDNPLWLSLGNDGNFYGTTYSGGANGVGAIFKITPKGAVTTLYSFCAQTGCSDGSSPRGGLRLGSDGNFYGTTYFGGANALNDGTAFKITLTGTLTTLHSFDGTDGANPVGGIGQDTRGIFYGAPAFGGPDNDGTIFSLNEGLGPFVQTAPGIGKIGQVVLIIGTDLAGATSVTFNGTAATFKAVSSTIITATLPSGATTGVVQVVTPHAKLSSSVNFLVEKSASGPALR